MSQINFYQVSDEIYQFLFDFLNKLLLEKDKKILIYSDENGIKKLDDNLWSFKKTSFIPHLIDDNKNADKVPIIITNKLENKYNCNYLITTKNLKQEEMFINSFEKVCYILNISNENSIEQAKDFWNTYYSNDNFELFFYKKNIKNKWEQLNIFPL